MREFSSFRSRWLTPLVWQKLIPDTCAHGSGDSLDGCALLTAQPRHVLGRVWSVLWCPALRCQHAIGDKSDLLDRLVALRLNDEAGITMVICAEARHRSGALRRAGGRGVPAAGKNTARCPPADARTA